MPVTRSFVYFTPAHAVEDALGILRALDPACAVIECADPARRFYVFKAETLLSRMRDRSPSPGERLRIEQVLDLDDRHLADAFDEADPRGRDRGALRPRVLLDGDLIALVVLPDFADNASDAVYAAPVLGLHDRGLLRCGGRGPSPRSVVVKAPRSMQVGQRRTLLVKLSKELGIPGAPSVVVDDGEKIDVILETTAELEVSEPSEDTLTVDDRDETPPLRFELVGRQAGVGKVLVHVYRGRSHLATVKSVVEVTPESAATEDIAAGSAAVAPGPTAEVTSEVSEPLQRPNPAPDLALLVFENRAENYYTLKLVGGGPDESISDKVHFEQDPEQFFRGFFADIEHIVEDTAPSLAEKMRRLEKQGTYLFDLVMPAPLRARLWALRGRIRTFQVQSGEPWIPWELCKLFGPDDAGVVVEEGFLCEQFQLTRWPLELDDPPALELSFTNIGLVVPGDSGLSTASAERRFMLGLGRHGRKVTPIAAEAVELSAQLGSGTYDAIHFTGHGSAATDDIDRSTIALEKGGRFMPRELSGAVANLRRKRPLVFLNACQVGRAAMSLTRAGGWPHGFLKAGAGAFIAPYWSVVDGSASAFAEIFYRELLDGRATIGQAAQTARAELKQASDPTWLAYTVYAHPDARVAGGAREAREAALAT